MNLIEFLKNLVLKIKENHYTKTETDALVNTKIKDKIPGIIDGTSNVESKNLLVYQDLKTNNIEVKNKIKSNLTPFEDNIHSLGSSAKSWKSLYLGDGKAIKIRTSIPNPNKPGEFLSITPLDINESELRIKYANELNSNCIKISPNYIKFVGIDGKNIAELLPNQFNVYGQQSSNSSEGALQTMRLNGHHVRLDFDTNPAMIATSGELSIIPEHGMFYENGVYMGDYDRIKFGGREYVYFDVAEDRSISSDIILCYKPASSYGDIVPFAITKNGDIFYKGKKLEDWKQNLYQHTIKLGNDYTGNDITFSFYATKSSVFISFDEVANYFLNSNFDRNENGNQVPIPYRVNVLSAIADGNSYPSVTASAYFQRVNGQAFLRASITSLIDTTFGDSFTTEIHNYNHDFFYETEEDAGYFYASCVEV